MAERNQFATKAIQKCRLKLIYSQMCTWTATFLWTTVFIRFIAGNDRDMTGMQTAVVRSWIILTAHALWPPGYRPHDRRLCLRITWPHWIHNYMIHDYLGLRPLCFLVSRTALLLTQRKGVGWAETRRKSAGKMSYILEFIRSDRCSTIHLFHFIYSLRHRRSTNIQNKTQSKNTKH